MKETKNSLYMQITIEYIAGFESYNSLNQHACWCQLFTMYTLASCDEQVRIHTTRMLLLELLLTATTLSLQLVVGGNECNDRAHPLSGSPRSPYLNL